MVNIRQLEEMSKNLYKKVMDHNLDSDERFLAMQQWADVENELDRLARLGGLNDL